MSREEATRIAQAAQQMLRARKAIKIALPTAAALGAGAAIAVASIPGGDGTITGCYLTNTANAPGLRVGQLRVIDPSLPKLPTGGPNPAGTCLSDEATIAWNQQGPTGPQGTAGAQGLPGVQGPAGGQGPAGEPLIGETSFGISGNGKTFLKIEGIKGESSDKDHKSWIGVDSFSLGAQPTSAASGGGGAGAGKVTIQSFTITKPVDKATPLLLQGAASGKHYKEMVLAFERKAGGRHSDYLKFTFDNVMISGITDGTSQQQVPEERVTFTFQKCKETVVPMGPSGRAGTPVSVVISGNGKV